ncbi:MAG: DNA-binding response regulator [Oscillospiraceae bacterium]
MPVPPCAGAGDYLLKPFRDQELMAAIAVCGRRSRSRLSLSGGHLLLPKGDKSNYVLQTLEYIAEHYADTDMNITAIARHIGISEGHLSHVFKKETNYTVLGYLTQYRIHMALQAAAGLPVQGVRGGGDGGLPDVAYFGSTFKKLTGLSPSEYQDRCR